MSNLSKQPKGRRCLLCIGVDKQTITIIGASTTGRERLDAIVLVEHRAADIFAWARQSGLKIRDNAFALCGMWIRRREETA